jgi:hypothetical protein
MWKCSKCGNELKFIGKAEFEVGFDEKGYLDDEHEMLGLPDTVEIICEHCDILKETDDVNAEFWLFENAVWENNKKK